MLVSCAVTQHWHWNIAENICCLKNKEKMQKFLCWNQVTEKKRFSWKFYIWKMIKNWNKKPIFQIHVEGFSFIFHVLFIIFQIIVVIVIQNVYSLDYQWIFYEMKLCCVVICVWQEQKRLFVKLVEGKRSSVVFSRKNRLFGNKINFRFRICWHVISIIKAAGSNFL